jgi:3-hydroxyacyl-CoA dehydrogenase
VKEGLFRRLNEVARHDAVLMACTAHADATNLGRTVALMRFPENGVGMRLSDGARKWELVPANRTSERALATAGWVVQNLDASPAAAS